MQLWRDRRFVGSLLVAICLISLMIATQASDRPPGVVEWIWSEVLIPVEGLISQVSELAGGWVAHLLRFPEIVRESIDLRQEVTDLRGADIRVQILERENRRLRELLGLHEETDADVHIGRVSRRLPSNWTRQVTIDIGAEDEVGTGDIAVVPAGLVGKVIRTTPRTAQVMLITSPESGVGAEVVRTGDAGVAVGYMGQEGMLKVTFFDSSAEVSIGDTIVTSGLGEVYPHGIPVAEVVEVEVDDLGLLREVKARPLADMHKLHEVMLIEMPEGDVLEWFLDIDDADNEY